MKTIQNVLAILVLVVSLLSASAGVITVSDPGQETNRIITGKDVVAFTHVRLTGSDLDWDQDIFVILERRGFLNSLDCTFSAASDMAFDPSKGESPYVSIISFGDRQLLVGPVRVTRNMPIEITISAIVNQIEAGGPSDQAILAFDVTGAAVFGYFTTTTNISFEGAFPIRGTTYVIDTNFTGIVPVKITNMQKLQGGIGDEYLLISATGHPGHNYSVEASTNLASWYSLSAVRTADSFGNYNFLFGRYTPETGAPVLPAGKCFYRIKQED
jgi:hypothetical protein